MNWTLIQDAWMIFLGILVEATPFVLMGVLASNVLKIYVTEDFLLRWIPRNRLGGALTGSALGFVFPVCECGNIPVARSMIFKKTPIHVVISFLLAAPTFNPIVIFATLAAFRNQPEILGWRLGFSLAIAILIGFLFSFSKSPHEYLNKQLACRLDDQPRSSSKPSRFRFTEFLNSSVHEFFEMTGVLVLGGTIAAFSQIIVNRETIVQIGTGPVSSVSAMMLLAGVVSICSNVDSFFALSYTNTFTTPSLLAFLIFGPMIDIKALVMLSTIFRLRIIVGIGLLVAQATFLIAVFMNLNISSW